MPEFEDDKGTLSQAVNFQGVTIPIIAQRKSIEILIGQTDKSLLTVLRERESNHPNFVLTLLGPIASGRRWGVIWCLCEHQGQLVAKINRGDCFRKF